MTFRRRFRFLAVMFSLWALLFSQAALAGYLCPGFAKAAQAAETTEAGMPCAQAMSQAMDDERPGLCHAHCQDAQQASDHHQPPILASLAQLGAVLTVAFPAPAIDDPLLQAPLLRRATAPPLAVQHCCFRL